MSGTSLLPLMLRMPFAVPPIGHAYNSSCLRQSFICIKTLIRLLQVKAGHTINAVMTKTEREINADLLRQQAKLAVGK